MWFGSIKYYICTYCTEQQGYEVYTNYREFELVQVESAYKYILTYLVRPHPRVHISDPNQVMQVQTKANHRNQNRT